MKLFKYVVLMVTGLVVLLSSSGFSLNSSLIANEQQEQTTIDLSEGDSLIVNCPLKLVLSSNGQSWELVCGEGINIPTSTPTKISTVTRTVTPTHQATITKTKTPVPNQSTPTETSVASSTPITPTATNIPSGQDIQPFANAPACPTQDNNNWHGLWDYKRGCHYDHTHGDDPALADKYLGKYGILWGGQTISYPFSTSVMENTMKHGGNKISVRMPGYHPYPKCGTFDTTDIQVSGADNCVVASRVQYHAVGSLMDLMARNHSYYMEVYICSKASNYQQCGIVRVGGWADFAQLQAPHYSTRVVRPGGPIDFGDGDVMNFSADGLELPSKSGEPYVFGVDYTQENWERFRRNPPSLLDPGTAPGSIKATIDQWSMNDWDCGDGMPADSPCRNVNARIMFQVGDAFTLVDRQDPNRIRWICYGEPNCEYNGSLIGLNEIGVRVFQWWQPGGNGFVTFNGYTDRWGNVRFDNVCNSVSVDCVPFVLENAPVGISASQSDYGCRCDTWEYDIYFNNKTSGWIKHPN